MPSWPQVFYWNIKERSLRASFSLSSAVTQSSMFLLFSSFVSAELCFVSNVMVHLNISRSVNSSFFQKCISRCKTFFNANWTAPQKDCWVRSGTNCRRCLPSMFLGKKHLWYYNVSYWSDSSVAYSKFNYSEFLINQECNRLHLKIFLSTQNFQTSFTLLWPDLFCPKSLTDAFLFHDKFSSRTRESKIIRKRQIFKSFLLSFIVLNEHQPVFFRTEAQDGKYKFFVLSAHKTIVVWSSYTHCFHWSNQNVRFINQFVLIDCFLVSVEKKFFSSLSCNCPWRVEFTSLQSRYCLV